MHAYMLAYSMTHMCGTAVNQQALPQSSNHANSHYREPPMQIPSGPGSC